MKTLVMSIVHGDPGYKQNSPLVSSPFPFYFYTEPEVCLHIGLPAPALNWHDFLLDFHLLHVDLKIFSVLLARYVITVLGAVI